MKRIIKTKSIFLSTVLAVASIYMSPLKAAEEIEWLQWYASESGKEYYEALVDDFESRNPDIKVKLVTVPFGKMRESLIADHSVGIGSDVIAVNMPWTRELLDIGVLEPLDNYIENDKKISLQDLVQAPLGKIDGKRWMVPVSAFPFVLFYNKDLMEKAGVTEVPKTWDDLMASSKKINDPENGVYGIGLAYSTQPPSNGPIISMLPLLYTAGGRITKEGKPNFDNPEVIETLKYIKSLNDEGVVAPGYASKTDGVNMEEFSAGRLGFVIDPAVHISTFSKNERLNFGVAPVPAAEKSAYRVHGWELAISSKSKHKDEAWKFISYLLSPEVNAEFAMKTGSFPGNLNSLELFEVEDERQTAVFDILKNSEAVEELRESPKAVSSWQIMTEEIQAMLGGQQSAEDTAKNSQARWKAISE
uniref:ABC transporter substrate-binding protein n=1 Tax=Marinobacterium profundum TaxID=1714300 RepID=UPI00082BA1CA|nr:sugar ABC transporter substrate-binding protein [Marinobacterium profundum]